MGAPIDARISAIAARQSGRVARWQLLAAGIDPSAIGRRLSTGRLEQVHRGVYALPQTAGLPDAPETGALLACGVGAVLSHHSAATLWGLRPGTARPIHVTLACGRGCPRLPGVRVHRSLIPGDPDLRLHRGLPVTSPARTLLDVATDLTDRDIERLLDEGLFVRRIVEQAELEDVLARAGGHPGRARLARVLGGHAHSTRTDSPVEEQLLEMIRSACLPEPRLGVHVLGYRLDFLWPELRLAVEVDGYRTHGSPHRFEADRRRDARLLAERGIVVIRLTRQMIQSRPLETIAVVAQAVGRRQFELQRMSQEWRPG